MQRKKEMIRSIVMEQLIDWFFRTQREIIVYIYLYV